MRHMLRLTMLILALFLVPAIATAGWWVLKERPGSWRDADWSSSGVLPPPTADMDAAVYLMAARTGGLKGAFSVHSWLVFKRKGATTYDRYEKVGWGMPVRHNDRPADGRWYSNEPVVLHSASGPQAERLIPLFEAAIGRYPYSKRGDYHIWPGPNSNSFVAYLMRAVPEFGGRLPGNAVGRDFAPGLFDYASGPGAHEFRATLGGLAGLAVGPGARLELQLGGLVAGIDLERPALIVPAYGRVTLFDG